MTLFSRSVAWALASMAWVLSAPTAEAAPIFNMPHFVAPGEFALGVAPEVVLSNGAGVGVTARYTHGLTDLLNVSGMIGTGTGPRRFRVGADLTFDFFPDIEGQPGIGMAVRALYARVGAPANSDNSQGRLELTPIPYIHKAILTGGKNEVEPFLAIPFGMSFADGHYEALVTAVVGSMFKATDSVRYSVEFGIAINHTDTYFAGGISYYH